MAELDPIIMVETAAGETMETTSEHLTTTSVSVPSPL